jgi:hypothetical protein
MGKPPERDSKITYRRRVPREASGFATMTLAGSAFNRGYGLKQSVRTSERRSARGDARDLGESRVLFCEAGCLLEGVCEL